MAINNIRIRESSVAAPTRPWKTEAGATAILPGEPLKLKAAGSPYVIPCEDADLTIGTDTVFVGIAKSASTHTASADGSVDVYIPTADLVYESKVKTDSTFDTQAEIEALRGDRVVLDLTAGVYTLDVGAGDGANNAFYILGGDPVRKVVHFSCRLGATYLSL